MTTSSDYDSSSPDSPDYLLGHEVIDGRDSKPFAAITGFAVEAALAERTDAYSDLGGGLAGEHNSSVDLALFEGLRKAELPSDSRFAELARITALAIDQLNPQMFDAMSKKDQTLFAGHFHLLVSTMTSRARTLVLEGSETHPAFESYGFKSGEEAKNYAYLLDEFLELIKLLPVYQEVENYFDTHLKGRRAEKQLRTSYKYSRVEITNKKAEVIIDEPVRVSKAS